MAPWLKLACTGSQALLPPRSKVLPVSPATTPLIPLLCSVWADHQVRILSKELTCPLCRSDWGPFLWRPPPPKRAKATAGEGRREERRDTVHYGTHCGACRKVGAGSWNVQREAHLRSCVAPLLLILHLNPKQANSVHRINIRSSSCLSSTPFPPNSNPPSPIGSPRWEALPLPSLCRLRPL